MDRAANSFPSNLGLIPHGMKKENKGKSFEFGPLKNYQKFCCSNVMLQRYLKSINTY